MKRSELRNVIREEIVKLLGEGDNWIQGAIKRPGALHKKLGVDADEKISKSQINKELEKLRNKDSEDKTAAEKRTQRQLNLAKTLSKISKKKS